jgi:hypothetical protein
MDGDTEEYALHCHVDLCPDHLQTSRPSAHLALIPNVGDHHPIELLLAVNCK